MKLGKYLLSFFFLAILFVVFTPKSALAADFQLQGSVKDNSANSIVGATVDVYTPGTTNDVVPSTTTDANGRITIQFTTVTDNAMVNGIEISKN